MANKFIDSNGLLYLWQKITNIFVKKEDGKGLSESNFTNKDKEKLDKLKENPGWDDVLDKPTDFPPSEHTHETSDINGLDEELAKANENTVRYIEQTLNEGQKEQARKNIGAGTSNFAGGYNDLTDRPFYIKDESLRFETISWEANVESLSPAATLGTEGKWSGSFYKVSDVVLNMEQLDGSTVEAYSYSDGSGAYERTKIRKGERECPLRVCSKNGSVQLGAYFVSIAKENDTVTLEGFPEKDETLVFAEPGTYFMYLKQGAGDGEESIVYVRSIEYSPYKCLDSNFIDDDIPRSGEVIRAWDKGVPNGVASLDESGHVPSDQLPSYVDDVIEGYFFENAFYTDQEHESPIEGEKGKIYIDLSDEGKTYRWGGTMYVPISSADLSPLTNSEIDEILKS